MPRLLRIALPLVILGVSLLLTVALVRSRPRPELEVVEPPPPLVRVLRVVQRDVPFVVRTQGTVLPRTETTLAAQVAAQVTGVAPRFEVGGFFERGEVLLTLDPRDFELAVERRRARVAEARVRLTQEEAEARMALEEWRELGRGEADPLVLREPQIAAARAAVAAAEAELAQARLDLERTRIRAPFTGRIHRKHVDLGQFVAPGQPVATLHAIDYAEVRLPITQHEMAFLDLPGYRDGGATTGPRAILAVDFNGERHTWEGRVTRTEGELDESTRMLHLVARVDDPYGDGSRPPLIVGLFVDAEILGRTAPGAVVLPRGALRPDDRVLVVDRDDRLRFRRVDVLRLQGETAVVAGESLETGERVCVSQLDVAVDGMRVRTVDAEVPAEGPAR